jgi:ferredoxin-thioredoxin reductase catalytic subunit/rubredoxin
VTAKEISGKEIDDLFRTLKAEAVASGYFFNPDDAFARDLIRSLVVNRRRYGYLSCPCRLASGSPEEDRDIVCPCDYRDLDISEYGACFCALYVSVAAAKGEAKIEAVPERRPNPEERDQERAPSAREVANALPYPVWRCRVCGYLCARQEPPDTCPICKVKKDRFERFM